MSKWVSQFVIVALLLAAVSVFILFDGASLLSLSSLKDQLQFLVKYKTENPAPAAAAFLVIYISCAALSFPGATVLTLAGGALFGLWQGFILVSLASTLGATLAFLGSRFLLRDFVQKRFGASLVKFNQGVEKEGAFYLFSLRLVPVFPFFLVNLVMGLTPIRTLVFFFVSQLGMIPGTIAYVNAGTQLGQLESLNGILSPSLLASFTVLGLLPLLSRQFLSWLKSTKNLRKFKKPKKFDYNMVVIGAGSAGLVSAYIAAAVKAKVALIEMHKMGGDCLNTGCVPSKALIRSARVAALAHRAHEFGVKVSGVEVDFSAVMKRIKSVITEIAPHDSVDRYSKLGVDCITGRAEILSPYEVQVNGKVLTTKNIVVATGASPLVPNIPGLKDLKYLTSDNIWNLTVKPKRLLVLGGGAIGCELAQSFQRLGSQVTLIEQSSRILAKEDPEVSAEVEMKFKKEGLAVLTGYKAVRFNASQKSLLVESTQGTLEIEFDEVLVAVGRKPNVSGFGLEALQVEVSPRGLLVADQYLRTTQYSNVYVCGDVTGPFQLTHAAAHQAWYVAVNSLFSPFKKFAVDYKVIPWCTFTDPEVARVGLSEEEAKELKIPYEVSRYGLDDLDRAIAENEAHGFVKVLTVPGKDKILGAVIVGENAGELITEFVAAMKNGYGLNRILGTIHIYPTLSEANKYAAGVWKRAQTPEWALRVLAKFHSVRRG